MASRRALITSVVRCLLKGIRFTSFLAILALLTPLAVAAKLVLYIWKQVWILSGWRKGTPTYNSYPTNAPVSEAIPPRRSITVIDAAKNDVVEPPAESEELQQTEVVPIEDEAYQEADQPQHLPDYVHITAKNAAYRGGLAHLKSLGLSDDDLWDAISDLEKRYNRDEAKKTS